MAESEVVKHGGSITDVSGSGHINSPDSGIDVRVFVKNSPDTFASEFIPNPNSGFQAKNSKISNNNIEREMCPKGNLRESIRSLSHENGAYILISADEYSYVQREERKTKMREVINKFKPNDSFTVDIYDLSFIEKWLKQHPNVMLWLKSILGQDTSGWKSFGNWSSRFQDDTLILGNGTQVEVPNRPDIMLPLIEGINEVRKLILSSDRAVRIAGLSGVGKTRFVQALFEENVGEEPLDRTNVIYKDIGANSDNSELIIEQLIVQNQNPIVVLDNCPLTLHNIISTLISSKGSKIKLITIEYDIVDNLSQDTDVVKLNTCDTDIATALVLKHFGYISTPDAHKIAKLAEGKFKNVFGCGRSIERCSWFIVRFFG